MNSATHPLEAILRFCEAAGPAPWYPSVHARTTGTVRDQLDPYLDELRVAGLIRLTDWVPENGQGYVLTPAGVQTLQSPRALSRIRAGQVPTANHRESPAMAVEAPTGGSWQRAEAVREALLGSYTPVVTYTLLFANIAVFAAGMALAAANNVSVDAYLSGGDNTGAVREIQRQIGFLAGGDVYVRGEWWRLITACFGHIGWIHLAVNMYSLYAVGPLLERLWGPTRFLVLYLLSGLGGTCGMLIESPLAQGAGASGALWGIMASLATWLYLNRNALPGRLIADWRRQLITVFILNMIITLSFQEISKGGHFGGGLIGLIAAVPLDYLKFGTRSQRLAAILGLVAIPVICIAIVIRSFAFTGPVLQLQASLKEAGQTYNRAAPLINQGGLDGRTAAKIDSELGAAQVKLEEALNAPTRPFPPWLPSQDSQWNYLAGGAQELIQDYRKARVLVRRGRP
jgi:membrane associated rhomboid family serine protease